MTIYYDVFTYHDLSSDRPLQVGDNMRLDGEEWTVMKIGEPVHDGKAATLYCKHANGRPAFPADWPPPRYAESG